jgi:predicted DNA-binding transcriptional regulator AlpA
VSTAAPRRVIRGRKAFYTYAGVKETQQRELADNDPTFPKPFKPGGEKGRGLAWFEDEIAEWQRLRVEQRDAHSKRELKVPSIDQVTAELSNQPLGEVRKLAPEKVHHPRNRLQARR